MADYFYQDPTYPAQGTVLPLDELGVLNFDPLPTDNEVPFSADTVRSYTRVFDVHLDPQNPNSKKITAPDLMRFCGLFIPRPFDAFTNADGTVKDPLALCTKITVNLHPDDPEARNRRRMTFEYSTQMPEGGPPIFGLVYPQTPMFNIGPQAQPWLEPYDCRWDEEVVQYPLQWDLDKKPFQNSANDPFVPAPTFPVSFPVLVVTRNFSHWSREAQDRYSYCTNLDPFLDAGPNEALMHPPKPQIMWRGPQLYYRVTFRIKFKPTKVFNLEDKDWKVRILDQGYNGLYNGAATAFGKPLAGTKVPLFHLTSPANTPHLLDGKGKKIGYKKKINPDTGQPIEDPAGSGNFQMELAQEPVFLEFKVHHGVDFAGVLDEAQVPMRKPPGGRSPAHPGELPPPGP